jgi:hypothetical protein
VRISAKNANGSRRILIKGIDSAGPGGNRREARVATTLPSGTGLPTG